MKAFELENHKSGYISIRPSWNFDFYHHQCFSYSKDIGFCLNLNPLEEPELYPIENLKLTDRGYAFTCYNRNYLEEDTSILERKLSKFLVEIGPRFSFNQESKTNLSIEYTSDCLVSLRMSTHLPDQEPSFFKLIRADDGFLYSGDFPLSETEAVFVDQADLDGNEIIINQGTSSEIIYTFYLQAELRKLLAIVWQYL